MNVCAGGLVAGQLLAGLLRGLLPGRLGGLLPGLVPGLLAGLLATGQAQGASIGQRFCDLQQPLSVVQQDRLLRFAAIAQKSLDASGAELALVARSGLNLQRFGVRYSHSGISQRAGELGPWSVRQMYYGCDAGRPQLFDQGLAGFVAGADDPEEFYLSAVWWPARSALAPAQSLLQLLQDKPRALSLVAAQYSANAYAYSVRYQNCNQWLLELLALAWGEVPAAVDTSALRQQAQAWLQSQAYLPIGVDLGSHLWMALAPLVPWVHLDDHPEQDRFALRLYTSLPTDIQNFVRQREPQAQRFELCQARGQVVLRQGWQPIAPGCVAEAGDQVLRLDAAGDT